MLHLKHFDHIHKEMFDYSKQFSSLPTIVCFDNVHSFWNCFNSNICKSEGISEIYNNYQYILTTINYIKISNPSSEKYSFFTLWTRRFRKFQIPYKEQAFKATRNTTQHFRIMLHLGNKILFLKNTFFILFPSSIS